MRSKWYNTGQMVDSHLPLTNRRSERRMATFSIPPSRLCLDCSADISGRGNRSFCCVDCAKTRACLRQQEYYQLAKETPGYKERIQKAKGRYRQTAHGKNQRREYQRQYHHTPAGKAYRRYYRSTDTFQLQHRQHQHSRRARQRNQLGIVTDGMIARLHASAKCAICVKRFTKANPMQIDHIVPLAKGGLHDDSNLQALCAKCNQSKNARDPLEFARENGRLL